MKLPPCDHDECPPTHCKHINKMTSFNADHKDYPAYRQKCAEIDGWKFHIENELGLRWYKLPPFRNLTPEYELPTYLDDASIDAVIRKLDDEQFSIYVLELMRVLSHPCEGLHHYQNEGVKKALKATQEQKAEALYRTLIGGDK